MPRYLKYGHEKSTSCYSYNPPAKRQKNECVEQLIRNQLAVVCNPWEEVDDPRFPDGKAQFSIGKRHANSEELKIPELPKNISERSKTGDFPGSVVIALFAGVNNHCVAVQLGGNNGNKSKFTEIDTLSEVVLSNHIAKTGISYVTDYPGLPAGTAMSDLPRPGTTTNTGDYKVPFVGNTARLLPESQAYTHWRPVSVGLRLKCLNNETEDGGWWEAIRTNRNLVTDRSATSFMEGRPWGVAMQTHNKPTTTITQTPFVVEQSQKVANGNLLPFPEWTRQQIAEASSDWGGNQSYCQGKLTDLACMEFQLNCIRRDNDFKQVRAINFYDANYSWFQEGNDKNWVEMMNVITPNRTWSTQVNNSLGETINANLGYDSYNVNTKHQDLASTVHDLYSEAFDIIFIRIHGNPGKTKLFLESVCNREYMLPSSGTYAEWQTPAFMDTDKLYDIIDYRNARYLRPVQRLRKLE